MTKMLTSGDQFPDIKLSSTEGASIALTGSLDTPYTIVLIYRGHW